MAVDGLKKINSQSKEFESAVYTLMCREDLDESQVKSNVDLIVKVAQEGNEADKNRVVIFIEHNLSSKFAFKRERAELIINSLLRKECIHAKEPLKSKDLIN